MQEGLGSNNVVMRLYITGTVMRFYVRIVQERLVSINVVMEVVSQWGGFVILCQDHARTVG